tara:strand:+ start:6193 stop:6417 length:225 start_codon:yes stop_codon:yes gene_type:complete
MNDLSKYLVNTLKEKKKTKEENIKNRKNTIDFNNFFKYSGKQELNNKFVLCSTNYFFDKKIRLSICNDMSKYKY